MSERITVADLARGLAEFRHLFGRLDVFADDVAELSEDGAAAGSTPLRHVSGQSRSFVFEHGGETFVLNVTPDGVAQIREADDSIGKGAVVGSALGAMLGAASEKKGGWAKGLLFGMLVGSAIGAASSPSPPKRVLTVRFDPATRSWAAYDGGLVTWLKSELEPTV